MPPKSNKSTLKNYFSTDTSKSGKKRVYNDPASSTPPKRRDDGEEEKEGRLSPEQADRLQLKKTEAESKLWAKRLEAGQIGPTWMKILLNEFSQSYFQKLMNFVQEERSKHTVYPPANEVFSWTNACTLEEVKVVIIGQDPYHGPNQAHGLCFSVKPGVASPPSLVNMYKELETDIDGFKRPAHGCLIGWAKQGVLLLNAGLTVRAHKANSHQGQGWEKITDAVIRWLNDNAEGLVFLLWGTFAQKKAGFVNKKNHHVLKGVHPSPLSAHKGFFGCKHFSQVNKLLSDGGKKPIDWGYLPNSLEV